MKFANCRKGLSREDLHRAEMQLGVSLPEPLRRHYAHCDGGSPEPHVLQNESIDTVVSECLPLKPSGRGSGVAEVYDRLVRSRKLVPRSFIPIAVDGGGDYFFVDTDSVDAAVYFYRSDALDEDSRLTALKVGIEEFWSALKEE